MDRARHLTSVPVLFHVLILRPLLRILFGVGMEGREHLEGVEQFILVANHNSHLDSLLLFHVLPLRHLRRTHPVGALDYFSQSRLVLRLADFLFQPVWIVRGDKDSDPLEGMRARLREGHCLVIFPEGTRGDAGKIKRFKTGVARLASEFPDVPVVPVYLSGPERALPRTRSLPIPLWNRAIVGLPLLLKGTVQGMTETLERILRDMGAAEAESRHRRIRRPRTCPSVAVLGIDGSGKSTLSRALAKDLSSEARTCLVTDDVALFEGGARQDVQILLKERLREAIGRRAKTARSLKSYKIPKLVELLLRDRIVEDVRRWYTPDAVVMDGSPLLNIVAWAKLYREDEVDASICASALRVLVGRDDEVARDDPVYDTFPELVTLRRLRLAHLVLPDAVLFLDVDPELSMKRIHSRGETRQVHETGEKLARLREGYRLVCEVVERDLGVPTRIVDGHQALDDVVAEALRELRGMDAGIGERADD